jgi:hypothetical protein
MRVLLALLFLCCASVAVSATVTDSAGGTVDVPDKVGRLYASGPPASVLVYALAPETLIGWPRALRCNEIPYIVYHIVFICIFAVMLHLCCIYPTKPCRVRSTSSSSLGSSSLGNSWP